MNLIIALPLEEVEYIIKNKEAFNNSDVQQDIRRALQVGLEETPKICTNYDIIQAIFPKEFDLKDAQWLSQKYKVKLTKDDEDYEEEYEEE